MKYRWHKAINAALMLSMAVSALLQPALPAAASPDGFTFHSGFETGDFAEWNSAPGTTSVQSTIWNTGGYAMRVNPTEFHGFANATGSAYRSTVYLYIATPPDTDCSILGAEGGIYVGLSSGMNLELHGESSSVNRNTDLVTGRWYRISLCLDAANDTAKVYLDGVEECSSDTITGGSLSNWLGPQSDVTADLYFDDYASDDIESTDDIGDVRVLKSQPNAMGTYTGEWQQFPTSTNHYEKIDECPADDTDYTWAEANGEQLDESYGLEDCSALGLAANDTVKAVSIWWRYETNGGGENQYASMVRDDGTDYYDWAIGDPTTPTWRNRYYATMPSGGASWTQARFNDFEVGMATIDWNKDMWLYCVMVMVAYMTPAAESYRESAHTTVWGTAENPYDATTQTVYIYVEEFIRDYPYRVAYYDAPGTKTADAHKIQTHDVDSDVIYGHLSSEYLLSTPEKQASSDAGTWHAIACERTQVPPDTYDSNWQYIIVDDSFVVLDSAIPEFPTVLSAIIAIGLCLGFYFWMRKRSVHVKT